MQEQTHLREDNWQSPPCSKPEPMFMNDKQSKLVRSSTAQCNDLSIQMQTGDLLQYQYITAQAPALRAHASTASAIEANSIDATGHYLSRLNAPAIGAIRLLQDI